MADSGHSRSVVDPLKTEASSDRVPAGDQDTPYRPPQVSAHGNLGCTFCGHTRFRRSRVRLPDLGELLMLRYPLRCMRCNQRQYGYFLTAALAHAAKSQTPRFARGDETWKAWTERDIEGRALHRPMTSVPRNHSDQKPSRPNAPRTAQMHRPSEDNRHIW